LSEPGAQSNADLARLLGDASVAFRALAERAGTICEWKRYSRLAPWALKVGQGKRTLFYLEPTAGAVKVTVVLGEHATEAALGGQVSRKLQASISTRAASAMTSPNG